MASRRSTVTVVVAGVAVVAIAAALPWRRIGFRLWPERYIRGTWLMQHVDESTTATALRDLRWRIACAHDSEAWDTLREEFPMVTFEEQHGLRIGREAYNGSERHGRFEFRSGRLHVHTDWEAIEEHTLDDQRSASYRVTLLDPDAMLLSGDPAFFEAYYARGSVLLVRP